MSRGIEIIETVWPTGSSETTIIVSVRNVFRPTPWSTPTISTFWRGTPGGDDLIGRLAGDFRGIRGERLRRDQDDGQDRDRQRIPPADPREAAVGQTRADGRRTPHEEQGLKEEQGRDRRRIEGDPEQAARRDDQQAGDDDQEGREGRDAEQRGTATAPGSEVAETRKE
jgi:hypothetical protein